jgi:N-acetylneuraminic acid mutarotase
MKGEKMDLVWKGKANLNQARASMGATISRGRVYVCGGDSGVQSGPDKDTLYNPVGTMEEFTPLSNKWVAKKDMPTKRSDLSMTAAITGMIYAIGGYNLEPLNNVEEYDPMFDLWTAKAPMPTARFLFGTAMGAKDGKIYAIGGWGTKDQGWVLDTVECYDPLNDVWKTLSSMPTPRGELAVAAASNGKIYAIGGIGKSGTPLDIVEEYDPKTDTWTSKAPMPTRRYCLAAAAASNDMIYAIGGLHSCAPISIVEEYDPSNDSWAAKSSMLTARWFLTAVASFVPHNKIYAIGGAYKEQNGSNLRVLATVEEGALV